MRVEAARTLGKAGELLLKVSRKLGVSQAHPRRSFARRPKHANEVDL